MPRLDLVARRRVIVWRSKGLTVTRILQKLEDENIVTSRKTIYLLLHKYKQARSLYDLPRGTRKNLL